HFRYIQFIKIYDEVAPTIDADEPADCFAGTSVTCTAEVELTFTALDECSDANVQIELDANYVAANGFNADNPAALGVGVSLSNDGMGGFTINATNVPVGNHAIRVRASDGCGNFDVEIIEFCVTGDKAPTPICIQTLTVTLMPDGQGGGMAAIWASDFIASDVEDCFGNIIDKYSIYTEEEAGVAGFAPAAGRLGIDLDCDDFGNDVPVRVYAIDDQGSADYCSVIVEVQAFQDGLCEGTGGNLAGNIATQDNDEMEGVEVNLTGANDMDEMVTTAANGGYSFTNLPLGQDFTVEANYSPEVDLSQVKVSDVVKIGSVILGTSTFDNGYDFVAGDVDQDGSLSIFDMVAIQRVILGRDETFTTGDTWRFVTEEYDLTTSNWASVFPEVYNVNNLAGVLSNVDFVAIEMGNVVREGGRSALNLETEEASLEAGQTHTMTITAANMLGFQGTIELAAGLELVDVTYEGEGGLNLDQSGEGMIGVLLRDAASLTLEVRATEAGLLSELVSLTDAVVLTEGVDLNGASTGLGLAFNGTSIATAQNTLLQNTPNPVVEATTIRFELATAGAATLSVQDAAGRVVMVRELDAVAGMNRVDLTAQDLGAAGVLTYTLTSGDFVATKKMVVVR
ncbi:T9SS type A sorting domain-containing protein, partial [Neolewinella agarilytica]